MILEVRHLNLVVAVAEERSVTKAGNRLHLTQSAVSHQLKDIEERLGTRLFHRDRKTMVLTAAGERLLETARGVIAQLERAEEETRDIGA
jgi:LysR family transcriptional regulator for metE and metH